VDKARPDQALVAYRVLRLLVLRFDPKPESTGGYICAWICHEHHPSLTHAISIPPSANAKAANVITDRFSQLILSPTHKWHWTPHTMRDILRDLLDSKAGPPPPCLDRSTAVSSTTGCYPTISLRAFTAPFCMITHFDLVRFSSPMAARSNRRQLGRLKTRPCRTR